MMIYDVAASGLRGLNALIRDFPPTNAGELLVKNVRGNHAVAVGADTDATITINGSVGYYCAGMNKKAHIYVKGSVGPGVAENMMSGRVEVDGDASQYAGATARGGLLIIRGNASSRCGISMKGADIVVRGNIGHMSAFMAQAGTLVVCGNAGEALGDSIYEAKIFVRGMVASLGADCVEKEMEKKHFGYLLGLLKSAGIDDVDPAEFRRYGSARKLYHFDIENVDAY